MPSTHFPRRITQRELERLAAIRANVRDWETDLAHSIASGAEFEAGELIVDYKALRLAVDLPAAIRRRNAITAPRKAS